MELVRKYQLFLLVGVGWKRVVGKVARRLMDSDWVQSFEKGNSDGWVPGSRRGEIKPGARAQKRDWLE